MTEKRLCPKCGAEISPDAAQGLCPKCLLDAGFESQAAGDERENTSSPPAASDLAAAETVPPADSASGSFPTPQLESLAPQFPQLDSLEFLGRGGMGVVYKARQCQLNRLVAVKILTPRLADDPAFAERFTREAQALARLNHSNIVQVYDFGQTDEFFYFVMEFVDGVNLRALIHDGKLNPEEALKIVPQICEALQFAHDEGIVHRDIKPENILVDKKGRVKIADFGIAKLLGHELEDVSLTGTGQLMGTLGYMAPEQLQGARSVDHRADIYSLGVVFYEMLTGQLPIGKFEPPSKKVQVDVRLDEVVLRALESEPERRYQQASEVKTHVETIRSSGSGRVAPRTHADAKALAPGMGPRLLLLSISMVFSALVIAGGVALVAVAVLTQSPGSGGFWGWLGGAFGCLIGGAGALIGTWNSYRQLEGAGDLMQQPSRTWLDRALAGYTVMGVLAMLAALVLSPWLAWYPSRYVLLLLGGIVTFQGVLFLIIRGLMKRAAQQEATAKVSSGTQPSGATSRPAR